jgi:hypothetical protein
LAVAAMVDSSCTNDCWLLLNHHDVSGPLLHLRIVRRRGRGRVARLLIPRLRRWVRRLGRVGLLRRVAWLLRRVRGLLLRWVSGRIISHHCTCTYRKKGT